ncbi:MAG: helix-hairpin-helix domain-containing protein [Deltaproteobacteria bacterium]|nr:helix-hairpin-helix domain-containing protein [Deltaproteobacteria bacterium]
MLPLVLALLLAAPDVGPPALVDLNAASEAELMTLPGVGQKRARAIVARRPFLRVKELRRVKGIGARRYAKLKAMVTVARFPRARHRPGPRPRRRPPPPPGCTPWLGVGPGVPP